MKKLDLKKQYKEFYSVPKGKIMLVDVPAFNYLAINGQGNPNSSLEFKQAIEALFSVSYTLKFMVKKGGMEMDYGVMPLEGQWWADDMNDFTTANKDTWKWTAMIMQPEFITDTMVKEAMIKAGEKKPLPALVKMRFELFKDGKAVQVLHIGPFDKEGPTIEKLHAFIHENGYELSGKHREIYLSDFRKAAPEKLKTIIRQPVK